MNSRRRHACRITRSLSIAVAGMSNFEHWVAQAADLAGVKTRNRVALHVSQLFDKPPHFDWRIDRWKVGQIVPLFLALLGTLVVRNDRGGLDCSWTVYAG